MANTIRRVTWVLALVAGLGMSGCTHTGTPGPSKAVCGNGQVEAGEVCDGQNLNGKTCQDLGLKPGKLACATNCLAFDTSGCGAATTSKCGNGVREGTEVCDGADLAGQSCTSLGFTGGTLGCKADCTGFDTAACTGTCTPDCSGRACGPDPVCGMTCGACPGSETCSATGHCAAAACTVGTSQCTSDGSGFQVCGPDPSGTATPSYGPRVPCMVGDTCSGAAQSCQRQSCLQGEVVLLVDRSSSMLTSKAWSWFKDSLLSTVAWNQASNLLGVREFPEADACSVGSIVPPGPNNLTTITSAITDPTTGAATPIQAALGGLTTTFGDPNDGQAVILLTDGDESCGTESGAVQAAEALWRSGIKVYAIGITSTANKTFLDQIAAAGGTGSSTVVSNGSELTTALTTDLADLGACACPTAGKTGCVGDTLETCSSDRASWQPNRTCLSGCANDTQCAVEGLTQVSAGDNHTCALKTDGTVVCFGNNGSGQSSPPAGTFTQVSAGTNFTCGLKTDGTAACWGTNNYGESSPPSYAFTQVSAGYGNACGIDRGMLDCWGGGFVGSPPPSLTNMAQVTLGYRHGCVLSNKGHVYCWGDNTYGQGTPPTGVVFTQISAGGNHTCGVEDNGKVACWGDDAHGQSTPPSGTFIQVSAGDMYTCGVKTGGTLVCWGASLTGPAPSSSETFVQVSAGYAHACAIRTDHSIVCWGGNGAGESSPPPG